MTFATHQTIASAYHLCVPYKMLTYLAIFRIYCDLLLPLCEKKQNRLYFLLLLLIFQFCVLRASTFGGVLLKHGQNWAFTPSQVILKPSQLS